MATIFWFLALTALFQVRGQAPSQAQAARASISGVVFRVDAPIDVRNLSNVVLELRPANLFATSVGGKFTFRNVPPGSYTLIPKKDGFVPLKDPGKGMTEFGMAIKVNAGDVIANIEVPMIPAPAISGFVYHPNGEPLATAVVQAYARRYTPLGPQAKIVKRVLTNDLGEYRLYWLNSGEHVVSASYGERVRYSALNGIKLSRNVSNPDDGYATVFYGGATNPGQARSFGVVPGSDTTGINIVMTDVARFKIQGQLVSAGAGVRIAFAPSGSDLVGNEDFTINAGAGGAFEIRAVSPGDYVILASGGGMSSDLIPVTVGNQDIEGLKIPLFPLTGLSGRLTSAGPRRAAELEVQLVRRSIEVDQRIKTTPFSDGRFILGVGVGSYDVYVEGLAPGEYIKSIRYLARDVLPTGIRIEGDSNAPLEIGVDLATEKVEGRVENNKGKPSAGVQIVLVPETKFRQRIDRYIIGYTDGTGNFSLTAVPPGNYTAYAFEQLEPGAYFAFAYSSQVNLRFANRGALVMSGAKDVYLRAIPAEETAGGFQ